MTSENRFLEDLITEFLSKPYVSSNIPNTMVIHGVKDIIVPIEQSLELIEKLNPDSVKIELHIIPEMNHMLRNATKEQKKDIQRWIVDFVERNKG